MLPSKIESIKRKHLAVENQLWSALHQVESAMATLQSVNSDLYNTLHFDFIMIVDLLNKTEFKVYKHNINFRETYEK